MADKLDKSLDELIKSKKKSGPTPKKIGKQGAKKPSMQGKARGAINKKKISGRRPAPANNKPAREDSLFYKKGNPDGVWRHDLFEANVGKIGAGRGRSGTRNIANRLGERQAALPTAVDDRFFSDQYIKERPRAQLKSEGIFSSLHSMDVDSRPVTSSTGGSRINVSNLPENVTAEDLEELFGTVGEVKRVVPLKGSMDIVFDTKEQAQQAVKEYNSMTLDGIPMRVRIAGSSVKAGSVTELSSGLRVGGRK